MRKSAAVQTAAALCLMVMGGLATPAQAERILRYSSWLPTNHWLNTEAMQPWMADVAAATGGTIKVEQLPKSVGTPAAQFDVCRDGLADICVIVPGYTPDRFPLVEVGELPFLGDDPKTLSPKFDTFYREHFLQHDELKGTFPLAFIKTTSGNIYTRADKPLNSLADIKGLKLRSPGRVATSVMELLGAVPVLKSSTEAYELLSTGVIDGSMMLTESVHSTNSTDLLKNGLIVPGGIFSATLVVLINQDLWNSLSEDERTQISSVSADKLAARFGKGYDDANNLARTAMTAANYNLNVAEGPFLEEIRTVLKPVDDEWIARATGLGVPNAGALLDDLRATLAD